MGNLGFKVGFVVITALALLALASHAKGKGSEGATGRCRLVDGCYSHARCCPEAKKETEKGNPFSGTAPASSASCWDFLPGSQRGRWGTTQVRTKPTA